MKLITERLELRPFEENDFEAVHSYAGNLDNVKYMIWGPNSEDETRKFIVEAIEKWRGDPVTQYDFAIILKDTGRLIGGCGIYLNEERDTGMLGWILHMDYWKKGYMPEVGETLICFGFEDLKLHRIYATCNANNYGSYRVMEKCGMRREAHFVKNRFGRVGSEKVWWDELVYGILDEEWENKIHA